MAWQWKRPKSKENLDGPDQVVLSDAMTPEANNLNWNSGKQYELSFALTFEINTIIAMGTNETYCENYFIEDIYDKVFHFV